MFAKNLIEADLLSDYSFETIKKVDFGGASTPQEVVSRSFLVGKWLPKTTCWAVLVYTCMILV